MEELAKQWLALKKAESDAQAARLALENKMLEHLDVPPEGSKTHKIEGFKIVVDQPIYRKVDPIQWGKVRGRISADLWPIKTTIEADSSGCKYLLKNEPEVWRLVASAFTAKPGKVGIKVEAV